MAVLLISSDLDEVVQTSHRIAIYRDGQILRTAKAEDVTLEEVMGQLTGAETDEDR
jgi:ABC-type sugar transport system ATPase subunit